jgi:hypothetical protein
VSQANQTFYATAAQVLPVLFLVAAVERRVIGRRHPETHRGLLLELGTIPLLVFTMAIGEIASIQALATNSSTDTLHVLTVFSLAIAGFAVLAEAIAGAFDAMGERVAKVRPEWTLTVRKARNLTMQGLAVLAIVVVLVYAFTG